MNPKVMKANIFLNVILPHLETLMEIDPRVPKLVRGWNNVIQFEVLNGGPAGYLEFTSGSLKVNSGRHGNPTVLFAFDSVEAFVDMIDGKSKPMPKKGMIHLIILLKFMKLTSILEKTLKPTPADTSDPEALKRSLTLLLNTVAFGMAEIAKTDDSVATTVKHLTDGVAQFRVMPDGPAAFVEVKNTAILPSRGEHPEPFVTLDIKDRHTALAMLTGELDNMAAIGAGDIRLTGYLPLFGDLSYIMGKIEVYMA